MPGHLRLTVRLPKDAYRLDGKLARAVLDWAIHDLAECIERCPTEQPPMIVLEGENPPPSP